MVNQFDKSKNVQLDNQVGNHIDVTVNVHVSNNVENNISSPVGDNQKNQEDQPTTVIGWQYGIDAKL